MHIVQNSNGRRGYSVRSLIFWGDGRFNILIGVVMTQMYTFVKTRGTVLLRRLNFIVSK